MLDAAVLIAIGVSPEGRRTILGVSVSLSEAEVHWQFLASLRERGLHGVRLVISDDHAGLKAARQAELTGVPWQRCQFQLQQNAAAYVPRVALRREVARALRSIFNSPDRREAERRAKIVADSYKDSAPRLAAWIEANISEGLTIFDFPEHHRRNLRTTNLLENLNLEVRRRTRVATLFPNEASLLRLVSAVLSEVSDSWEGERIYLTMTEDRDPHEKVQKDACLTQRNLRANIRRGRSHRDHEYLFLKVQRGKAQATVKFWSGPKKETRGDPI